MKNIKLLISYDGGAYLGWQKTREGKSIEETLQKVLEQILQHEVALQAASRTDAGVHAYGQVVNFFTEKELAGLASLQRSINALLPSDIVVRELSIAHDTFHPTLDCKGKEYRYSICQGMPQLPMKRHYSWHVPYPLDLSKMRKAASHLIGKQDYASLCNFIKGADYEDTIREVQEIRIEDPLQIIVTGDHFLYKMVRNIVGTIIYAGQGKILPEDLPGILQSKDRTQAGITAPAHGLSLYKVFY